MKAALWTIIQAIFIGAVWLTLQSAEGQLWAILVCSTPISWQSFTPLFSSSMKNSALTSSPGKNKYKNVQLNANNPTFSFATASPLQVRITSHVHQKKSYSPDFTDNSFSFTWQFFFCLQCLLLLDFTEILQQRTPLQTTQGLMALPRPLIVNHRPRKLNKRPCELNLQWEQNPQKL